MESPAQHSLSKGVPQVKKLGDLQLFFAQEQLANKAQEVRSAEEQYIQQRGAEPEPLEAERRKFIVQAKNLYARLLIELPASELQIKLTQLVYESLVTVYSADEKSDFDTVEFNFQLIEANLTSYKKFLQRQQDARDSARNVSIIAIIGMAVIIALVGALRPDFDSAQPIPVLGIPWSVLIWSFIGSMTAVLYRFNLQNDVELQDPFRWLYARPITGVVMGIVVYMSLKIGLIALNVESQTEVGGLELIWVAAFIGGFSDTLSDTILRLLVGRFGGDSGESPLTETNVLYDFKGIDPTAQPHDINTPPGQPNGTPPGEAAPDETHDRVDVTDGEAPPDGETPPDR